MMIFNKLYTMFHPMVVFVSFANVSRPTSLITSRNYLLVISSVLLPMYVKYRLVI
jgi:hypothetical protein